MATALLVIDVQESFRQLADDWGRTAHPDVAVRVGRLVTAARERGDLVVWVFHVEPGSGGPFDPASGYVRPIEPLRPDTGEPVVHKSSANAFTTTNLQQLLTTGGVTDVVICGIRTEQCCETTARVASDLGYRVRFVGDATTTSAIPSLDGASSIGGTEIIANTQAVLAAREFATIVTTDEVAGPIVAVR